MNLTQLQHKLIAAARANPPADRVPYAFERRIMARLTSLPPTDQWTVWARLLWRAATPCLGVMILVSAFVLATRSWRSSEAPLGDSLETTVYAALADPGE